MSLADTVSDPELRDVASAVVSALLVAEPFADILLRTSVGKSKVKAILTSTGVGAGAAVGAAVGVEVAPEAGVGDGVVATEFVAHP